MATCKDCLHYEACKSLLEAQGYIVDGAGEDADKRCDTFADKSRFIELPCKIGDTVYYITHVGKRKVKSAKVEKLYFAESRCRAFVFDKEEMLDFTINIEDCFLTREEAEAAIATKEKE